MQRIEALLAEHGPAQLADLPTLADDRIARLIDTLMMIGPAAHISQNPELFALSTITCFRLTLEHGIGPAAPKVIAMYAAVVRELTQNCLVAFDLSTRAMDLDRTLHGRISSPVLFLHAWFINHWISPIKTNAALAWDGARIGLSERDTLYGCFNAAAHVMYLGFGGVPLPQVVQEADRQLARIADRVRVAAFHCVLERQLALALMGRTLRRTSLSDSRYDEERDLASICESSNYNQMGYYFLAKLRLHYYYGEYETALEYAERALRVLPAFQGQVAEWEFVFYRALASAARAQEPDAVDRLALLETVDGLVARFDGWAAVGPANLAHKRDLLRAELLRARGDHESAAAAYDAAVQSAAGTGFIHDHALARERSASFCYLRDDPTTGRAQMNVAAALYEKWEAWAKVEALRTTGLEHPLV
jgi:tetratricopeptide (TPR) repeat protein